MKTCKEVITDFEQVLSNIVVLNDSFKDYVFQQLKNTDERLSKLTKEQIAKLSTAELYKEYEDITVQIKYLNIFSDEFTMMIYKYFYIVIDIHFIVNVHNR